MYSFASRGDCQVVDEPFYAYYLAQTGLEHPMRTETLAVMSADFETVQNELINRQLKSNLLFIKNMPHHLVNCKLDFAHTFKNFFLIREPASMIASFIKKIPNPTMRDLGLKRQWQLFEQLKTAGQNPPIVDSADLLANPEAVLRELCQRLDIPFSDKMLKWEAGPIDADGPWADYWYANVHASTGFVRPITQTITPTLPAELQPLLEECGRYYTLFYNQRITA